MKNYLVTIIVLMSVAWIIIGYLLSNIPLIVAAGSFWILPVVVRLIEEIIKQYKDIK